MQTHNSGCFKGNRLAANIARGSWLIPFGGLATGVPTKICTIPAGPNIPAGQVSATTPNPTAYKVRIIITVASNAVTSDLFDLGTTSGGNQILAAQSLKAAAGTIASPAVDFAIIKVDTDIWITETIVGAKTAGEFVIIIEPFEINTVTLNTLEA